MVATMPVYYCAVGESDPAEASTHAVFGLNLLRSTTSLHFETFTRDGGYGQ
jgi:hypothetical protein